MRYGTNGCMPAVVKRTVGSFSGMTDAPGIILCPLDSKNFKYISKFIRRKIFHVSSFNSGFLNIISKFGGKYKMSAIAVSASR